MLTLTFLGVGSSSAKRNFQSNALVEAWSVGPAHQAKPDDTLLIDFGGTGPMAMYQLKNRPEFSYLDYHGLINYAAIRRVLVTHLHADHVGGLEELARMNRHRYKDPITGGGYRAQLIGCPEVIENLWTHSLQGGLGAQNGGYVALRDYFSVLTVVPTPDQAAEHFTMCDRYEFTLFRTDHVRIQRKYDWPSCGLLITDRQDGETVCFSGDTAFDPSGLGAMMNRAKTIFHDVHLANHDNPVHASLSELRTLDESTRRKMILYHYSDAWDDEAYRFIPEEFAGFATPQRRYLLLGTLDRPTNNHSALEAPAGGSGTDERIPTHG